MAQHPAVILTAVLGGALAIVIGTSAWFAETIDDNQRRYYQQQRQAVLRGVDYDAISPAVPLDIHLPMARVQSFAVIKNAERAVAVVLQVVATKGYGGDIVMLLAVRADGEYPPMVRILTHRETPGIADFLTTDKAQAVFDGVSGATLSANAITIAAAETSDWLAQNFDWQSGSMTQ